MEKNRQRHAFLLRKRGEDIDESELRFAARTEIILNFRVLEGLLMLSLHLSFGKK
jgi:hypothetical protein